MDQEMLVYHIDYNKNFINRALNIGFYYVESLDDLVGIIYTDPSLMKEIVLAYKDEIRFDYIPQGIGIFRTAYLKFNPLVKSNEIRFLSKHETFMVKMFLI